VALVQSNADRVEQSTSVLTMGLIEARYLASQGAPLVGRRTSGLG
jgi:hypothetical protein